MKTRLLWALLVIGASTGCSEATYHAPSSGRLAIKGDVIQTMYFDYEIRSSLLRVQADSTGLMAYEDRGPGLPRGRTFVIRRGPAQQIPNLHEDLRQFGRTPAAVLLEGKLVATQEGIWRLRAVEFHLFEIPEISQTLDAHAKIVKRERTWVLGMIVPMAEQRFWISMASTEESFRPSEGIGGRNLRALLDFADGLDVTDNASTRAAGKH